MLYHQYSTSNLRNNEQKTIDGLISDILNEEDLTALVGKAERNIDKKMNKSKK